MSKKEDWRIWHGALGNKDWSPPECVAKTNKLSRQDQGNEIDASEYLDNADVLDQKMKLLADLLKKSQLTITYTGAGISKSSGIPDYGTKAENSVMKGVQKLFNPFVANPTVGHCVLVNLERRGLIHYYIQQNHDGLPQKAGFPQEKMNEIHGAWFDPSNPIVQFYGNLRGDLFNEMLEYEKKADLCLCMGTSLSGMNADRVVRKTCKRFMKKKCLGSVVINLQKTPVDQPGFVSLRCWAKIDDAMTLLLKHLEMEMEIIKYKIEGDIIECPYDENGVLVDPTKTKKMMVLDLSEGQKVMICKPGGKKDEQNVWTVIEKDEAGHFQIYLKRKGKLPITRRLGSWWMNSIKNGRMTQIPLVNAENKFVEIQ